MTEQLYCDNCWAELNLDDKVKSISGRRVILCGKCGEVNFWLDEADKAKAEA